MNICITRSQKTSYSETFIQNQIKGLCARANVLQLYSGRLPEKQEGGKLLSPYLYWLLHKLVKSFAGRNNYFSEYGIKKALIKNDIDVVLANYGLSASHMMPVCHQLQIPLVAHFHGYDATKYKVLEQYKNGYQKLFLQAAAIIAVSVDMQKKLIELGAPAGKVHIIPYGIDTDLFVPGTDKNSSLLFVAVGRFTAKKSPENSIRAFAQLLKKFPEAMLVMIGGKTELFEKCETLVKELGIEKSVEFPGVLPAREVAAYLQKAHVFLQHSVTAITGDMEGTPNSILEASASGLPVISTLHAGIKDAVVHGTTGFLVAENDVDAQAKYMMELAANLPKAAAMGLAGRAHIKENYEFATQIDKLYTLLKSKAGNEHI